ncbi:hemin uptake protein HemP [Luteimonas sp. YGD11-2]|uniref:hemin uptake protein HemP n=1 Tax=Luteimonas sp. YGD11-2 TaxID=2508168 RepID=UPI00100BECDE|nr:hemin uptake protein HemP [Luteimonas sp. YGD11-2]
MSLDHSHDPLHADPSATRPTSCTATQAAPAQVLVDSAGLLAGQREICIRHGNELYRLRHTRNDKLILTK